MQIETTSDADRECKNLIGEAYEAAYKQYPNFEGFSGLDDLWNRVQEVLARPGLLDLCTVKSEDYRAMDLLKEVFEEASRATEEDGHVVPAYEYADYQQLWERLCEVIGVKV